MDVIVVTGNQAYQLEYEHKNGWNAEMFKERYSEVLERYDYIVGDWGYNQLRLRGFYQEGHPRATKDTAISSLIDYLNEYCNFGCAYFVLRKTEVKSAPGGLPDSEPAAQSGAGGAAAQAEETAAAAAAATSNGMLMRWPLKERLGGPVRMPGAAAVARAAAEAERRQLLQAQQQSASGGKAADGRQQQSASAASDYGYGKPGQRAASGGGAERRPYGGNHQGGQADSRSGGRPGPGNRGPRSHSHSQSNHAERYGGGGPSKSGGHWRQSAPDAGRAAAEPVRAPDAGSPGPKSEAAKNGSRWPGKNRRKGRFGGKPNRPDAAPRDDGGSGRHAGE